LNGSARCVSVVFEPHRNCANLIGGSCTARAVHPSHAPSMHRVRARASHVCERTSHAGARMAPRA
jgi:hypothetical protein